MIRRSWSRGEGSLGNLQGQWYLHQRQDRRSDIPALHGSLRALEERVIRGRGPGATLGSDSGACERTKQAGDVRCRRPVSVPRHMPGSAVL